MQKQFRHTPPRWATRLLSWYCKPELLEDLQGDLTEYFERNVHAKGLRKARLIYVIDVLKFFRFYTVRKPEFINYLIHWMMLSSYIKTSGRSLVRNKLFSAINIAGLAVSMSVGLLLIGVLTDILSYDKFNAHYSRIYRVVSRYDYLGAQDNTFMATTSLKAARAIQETFTAPEAVAILRSGFDGDVSTGEKIVPLRGKWANPDLLNVFSFELLTGNRETVLKEPFSMVLTQNTALRLFNSIDVIGKSLTLHDRQYTVTGVLQDIPHFSHVTFDMLGSLSTRPIITSAHEDDDAWDNIWNTWVYVLLPEDTEPQTVDMALDELSAKEDLTVANTHIELDLQPFNQIMVGATKSNEIGPVLGSSLLWVFTGLAFVVLLSAFFNYTNLSVARALRRNREVGIRKVIGANKGHVIAQFIIEAVLISLCSLVVAVVFFFLLRPHFLSIEPDIQRLFTLSLTPQLLVYFILFAILVGALAGLFPALVFARVQILNVLKGVGNTGPLRKLTLRKALITAQFTISIILVTASIGIYHQYHHFVNYDLGFSTSNVLNISLQGNKAELLQNELMELPEVVSMSQSAMVTSVGSYWGTNAKWLGNPLDSSGVGMNYIDEKYLPLLEHTLLAGENFAYKADSAVETEVIVNERFIKRFSVANQNYDKAIGELIQVDAEKGKNLRIIGVVKDFQYGQANNEFNDGGILFRYNREHLHVLNVKLQTNDWLGTVEKIEAIWKKIDPVHPLEAHFYDEQIEEAFAGLRATVKVAGFLAFLAICIASLGLLGMVVFTAEVRLKEISVRKVMGASELMLLFLLSKSFLTMLLVSALIGVPITVVFFEQIVFTNVANSAPINLLEMLLGVLAVVLFAFLLIATQALKVASANPAEVLRNE